MSRRPSPGLAPASARKKAPNWAFTSGVSSRRIRSATSTRSRWPCIRAAIRVRLDSSQSLARVVSRRLVTMRLMLFFSSATSPCASTAMEPDMSPWVTALATSAIARTWVVGFDAQVIDVRTDSPSCCGGAQGLAPGPLRNAFGAQSMTSIRNRSMTISPCW